MVTITSVTVNLDVAVDSSGNISVFGQGLANMNNVIVASQTLPVSALYNSIDNGLFRFKQLSSNPNNITAERNTSFTTTEATIANNIKAIINASFDCSTATPFITYTNDYHTQSSFGSVSLSAYAHSLFGHVAATAAIDNDTALVNYINNDTISDAALNKALANALYNLSSETSTYIANQVIGQDSSRAKNENNESDWQAVEFKSGDIIYMSIRLLQPIVTISNNSQQSAPLSTNHTATTYAMKITLWDGIGVNPKNGGSSGGDGGGIGDFVLISYSQQSGVSTSSTAYGIDQSMTISPSPVGSPNSFSISPSLPTGLSINTTTGVISGTPTQETTLTTYTITARNLTNNASNTTDITFATVSTTAPTFTYYALEQPDGSLSLTVTNINVSIFAQRSGYIMEYSISPALPTSSSINPVSGQLNIVPTTTAYPSTVHTITATNGVAASTKTVTLQIGAITPVSITYPQEGSTITLYWGQSFPAITPSLSGSPNQFSISPALPTGMTLNTSTGVISGTPSQYSSAVSYTITATKTSNGLSDTSVLSIAVVSGGVLD